jgi:hypothetical protein
MQYPFTKDTIDSLLRVKNNASTSLSVDIDSAELTLQVANGSNFPEGRFLLTLEQELIIVSSRVDNDFTLEQRGAFGSVAAPHTAGARCNLNITAQHYEIIRDGILDLQSGTWTYRAPVEAITSVVPVTPTEGLYYIVQEGADGDWMGLDNKIVIWNGTSWDSITPELGFQIYDKTTENLYKFTLNGWEPGVTSVFGRTGDVVPTAGDYSADKITVTPVGNIAATNVQAAIQELDSEKEPADSTILKEADIGVSVQPYGADTVIDANYVHTDNNYTTTEKDKLAGIQDGAEVNVNADWDAVSGDAQILNKPLEFTPSAHTHDAADIVSGTIDIARLPASVIERLVIVADDTARFALTTATVQNGDAVKVEATGLMYYIKDQTQLSVEAGYEVFNVGSAASVPWSGITDKPSTFTPSAHTHSISDVTGLQTALDGKQEDITANGILKGDGAGNISAVVSGTDIKTINGNSILGSGDLVVTTSAVEWDDVLNKPNLGTASLKDVPVTGDASSTEVVLGDDTRLTDSREWSASDVSQDEAEAGTSTTRRAWTAQRVRQAIAAWWDITDAPQDSKQYARKDGSWAEVSGGGGGIEEAPIDGKSYGRKDGDWEELVYVGPPPISGIGIPGTRGFGVGVCTNTSILTARGLYEMAGTTDKASDNYGNYQHINGGIAVYIPKFYYRIGSASSPLYAAYGLNATDIVGAETFANEAEANAAGYALHRAFINAGVEIAGFFIDKYLASKDGSSSCKSILGGHPISLSSGANDNPSSSMTGCSGISADAIVLARARGAGWNCPLLFHYDALATISLAHGQSATSSTYCAWYDPLGVTNYPKGCTSASLKDGEDASVTYAQAYSYKPLTGAITNFNKTTHNGQACGVADLAGCGYQPLIGISAYTGMTLGDTWVLKRGADFGSLTGGVGGATDVWGNATNLANNFEIIAGFQYWYAESQNRHLLGNGSSQVFSGALSGIDYLRKCCGIPNPTGISASGTNLFGRDDCYKLYAGNPMPLGSNQWHDTNKCGIFSRAWNGVRTSGGLSVVFRAAACG